ncbi:hypothetical protein Tco_1308674, partial [Tanacetum coccineum]
MTKVIKGEFEKIKDVKVEDVSLTCDTPLEVFNKEVSRLSGMDNDSEHEADDDMGGDDEVELTDEESSDDEDEIVEVFRIETNIFNYKTPLYVSWVYNKQWLDNGIWKEKSPVKHSCKPFNYKTKCSEWPTCSWMDDRYCNGGNLPGTYIIGNQLHYQNLEWYEALEDCELKDEALRNKAIMEGFINEYDDETCYEQKRRWNIYTNYDDAYEINHGDNEREELCEVHELPICNVRRYMMIKYSFNNDEEYVALNKTNTTGYYSVRMTKIIKGEFEKIKDVKVEDVPLTCDAPLEVLNNEVSQLSGMDDDLFTYE